VFADKPTALTSSRRPTAPLFCLPNVCFAMPSSSPFNEEEFLKLNNGERTGVHPPSSVNANNRFQITSGPGRKRAGKGGKERQTGISNSTNTGAKAPPVPNSPTRFPKNYRSGWTREADPSCHSAPTPHLEVRFSSPSHTTTCSTAYCFSAMAMWEPTEERCSLGSPASVGLDNQIPTGPCDNSLAHRFPRKNNISELRARASGFSSTGRTLV
jgi:hypothetical protein